MNTVVFAYHDMGCIGINALLASGYRISAIFTHADTPGENPFFGSVARIAANARRLLGWEPQVEIRQTIDETLDFFLRTQPLPDSTP